MPRTHLRPIGWGMPALVTWGLACVVGFAGSADAESLGLFARDAFLEMHAAEAEGFAPPAALHHFAGEWIAVPAPDLPPPGRARADGAAGLPLPPLVWLAAPELVEGARLEGRDRLRLAGGEELALEAVPPLPDNELYLDDSTFAFFRDRPVRARGTTVATPDGERFVARTLWPADASIPWQALEPEPVQDPETLADLVRAQAPRWPAARLLWERSRDGSREWTGRAVLAIVLSGAQADSPGSEAGHIAVATGRFGADGAWAEWLVNNIYPIETMGAKGISSGPVPMDNYLTDLNSGQAMYRPVYVLVAVLSEPRAAEEVQRGFQEFFLRYWCREVEFHRARHNSTAMSLDVLRKLEWRVPRVGGTSWIKGAVAAVATLAVTLRPGLARDAWSYFTEERTDLIPRVAFEVAAADLMSLVEESEPPRSLGRLGAWLRQDLDAVLFLRFPQVPSSRPFGTYPVDSIRGYRTRVGLEDAGLDGDEPRERPLPEALREACRHRP